MRRNISSGAVPGDVVLEEHLERELPRLAAGAHQRPFGAARAGASRFAISTAASAASAPLPARARAWSIVSQVRRPKPTGRPVSAESAAERGADRVAEDLVVRRLAADDRAEDDDGVARLRRRAPSRGRGRQLEGARARGRP